jgi:hypothetical protein
MSTHLYCVLARADASVNTPEQLRGVNDAPVRALRIDDLVAWVSDVDGNLPVTIDGVKAHDAVVQAALDTGATPVPARYGQRFATDTACADALARQGDAIRSILSGLEGLVEMTVVLTPSTKRMLRDLEPVIPEMIEKGPGAGRRYLETLRAREAASGAVRRALDALAQTVGDTAQRFIRRVAVQDNPTRIPIRTVSHLVAREVVEQYKAALQAVTASGDSRFIVIGPRAPYSFSTLGPSGGFHGMKLAD